ncbi:MAG: CoA-binding protein [Candidatus Micrarchaeia archaeon]
MNKNKRAPADKENSMVRDNQNLNMRAVIEPSSIVVIGASRNPSKVGYAVLKNLITSGFNGWLYAVNPNADNILGVRCYKSIKELPQKVDCAIIAVPAENVNEIIEECGRKGVRGAIVISGGFKEVGEVKRELELTKICRKYGIAMIGPNCLGIVNRKKHVDSIFLPTYKMKRPQLGKISFVTQSGAVGSTILDLIGESNIGVSKFISYGNAAVIDESDLLRYLREDADTSVVVMYIEGVKDGRKFYRELKETCAVKPVVVLKAGKGALAAGAAKSHTGALAGDYKIFQAMLKQAGAVEATNLPELFNLSKIFLQPLPKGDRMFVLTNGGGDGVLAVDAIERNGLKLAQLSGKMRAKLRRILPKHVVVGNPFDLTGDADSTRYRTVLEEAVKEEGIDAIIAITLFQTAGLGSEVVNEIISADIKTDKTIVSVATGGEYTRLLLSIIESSGIPAYGSPSEAVDSIAKALWYYKKRGVGRGTVQSAGDGSV